MKPAIIVHGGAGAMRGLAGEREARYRAGLAAACRAGFEALSGGGSALDGVEAAIRSFEADGSFNAGVGGCLDLDGRRTLDAACCRGSDGAAGAVAAVTLVRHPISLARRVMEETDHILVVGEGADRLGRAFDLEQLPPTIPTEQRVEWKDLKQRLLARKKGEESAVERMTRLKTLLAAHPELRGCDTVGAVAVDGRGEVAGGVSTGGLWLKLPGRVGDSAIPGAGVFAAREAGASATGVGETIIRSLLTAEVCRGAARGLAIADAVRTALAALTERFGDDTAGVVALDRNGEPGAAFNTRGMGRAYLAAGQAEPAVAVLRGEAFPGDAG